MNGGRFDFDDGGTYCGGWEDGKAHGHGVCTGPKGQGEYSGAWHYGFEVSGVYMWPSGNTYNGQWQNGKRHGLGVERRGRWLYRGEWTQGYKGRYGNRQSSNSQAKYEGTWSSGLQDGYGTETYADGGTYQGQWLRGMRHGYGMRKSAAYGVAAKYRSRSHAHASLTSLRSEQGEEETPVDDKGKRIGGADESRGGFVLRARSEPPARRRRSLSERTLVMKRTILQGLRIKKQRSTGDIHTRVTNATGSIRSSGSTMSCTSDESGYERGRPDAELPPEEHLEPHTIESYMGEWKNDKRSGFGVSERSDGLRYEGEWFNNKKFGYGVTTLKDGTKEEGKYKNNVLVTSQRKKHLLFVRSSKLRERIDAAVNAASRASQIALQKADIAISRTTTARDRAEQADVVSMQAQEDSDLARIHAKQFDPNFHQPGTETIKRQRLEGNHLPFAPAPPSLELNPSGDAISGPHRARTLAIPKDYNAANFSEQELTPPMETPPTEFKLPFAASPDWTKQQQQKQLLKREQVLAPGLPASTLSQSQALVENTPINVPTPLIVDANPSRQSMDNPGELPMKSRYDMPNASSVPVSRNAYNSLPSPEPGPSGMISRTSAPTYQPLQQLVPPSNIGPVTPPELRPTSQTAILSQPPSRSQEPGAWSAPQRVAFADTDTPDGSAAPSQSSSRYSVNQIMNDHFDQYMMVANPKQRQLYQDNLKRTYQPSPSSSNGSRITAETSSDVVPAPQLTRRSTLSSARDWKGLPQAFESTNPPLNTQHVRTTGAADTNTIAPSGEQEEPRGSLPDLTELDRTPVHMTREEVARMSSQRRQELQRIHEDEELLRSNPLRYLFHPALRAWFVRWKLPLLVLLVNLCLSVMFYQLLTYEKSDDSTEDS